VEAAGLPLGALDPRCLVAIPDRLRRPVGLLVLGPRLSDEPYAEPDTHRLRSAAEHAGAALEVVRLAEQLAERMDAERRAEREIAIAREVQGKLFPQSAPRLRTVELAARCIQARSVGGDYYDFLDLGPGRVGFVLADVSGKGIHAALRMANLQAHVRSQAGSAPEDPLRVLRQVNRMLCESTQPEHFATLFLGVYNDASRRLTYINCGHNPPLCLRADGSAEWLAATATVLGVFEDWECTLGRLQLFPGDLLVAYSDGVTEAARGREHFGEARLIEALGDRARATPDELVSAVLARVQAFGAGEMTDDLTLVVARVR
jgi:serine phosphatase RsbU (regulator of sigma subunit)